jgi:3-keto-L-gulonate-6-phosphate decarboxylase
VLAGAAAGAGAAVVGAAVGVIVTVLVMAGAGVADRGADVAAWVAVDGATSVTVVGVAHAASPSNAAPISATPAGAATLAILIAHQAFSRITQRIHLTTLRYCV